MRSVHCATLVAGIALLAGPGGSAADEEAAPPAAETSAPTQTADSGDAAAGSRAGEAETEAAVPVFVPPDTGAPATRVGGASRGVALEPLPALRALVPLQRAYTLEAQPVLYWRLSGPTDRPIEFTLIEEDASEPVVVRTLEGPFAAGRRALRLADHGVTLEPGVGYLWYVSLVANPERRSEDRVAGGAIQRIEPGPSLRDRLEAEPGRRVFALARAGVWYDAIHLLAERAETDPHARARLAALLEQVGL